ncbi:hypothetical protein ACE6H2_004879 [Prunus campanulata]
MRKNGDCLLSRLATAYDACNFSVFEIYEASLSKQAAAAQKGSASAEFKVKTAAVEVHSSVTCVYPQPIRYYRLRAE